MYSTDLDPTVRHSYLSLLIGGGFTFMSLYAVNQTQVQRYLTMKDLKTAVRSLWLSIIILLLLSGLTCFSGLAIYSKYYGCDPVLDYGRHTWAVWAVCCRHILCLSQHSIGLSQLSGCRHTGRLR
ncbi:hypothetical protein J6590_013663 [Homalodisca vitripennis]|nr:hypothetical protein J6590_013663 [Homalodisca vitripennis]